MKDGDGCRTSGVPTNLGEDSLYHISQIVATVASQRVRNHIQIHLRNHLVKPQKDIKYLGVHIDEKKNVRSLYI